MSLIHGIRVYTFARCSKTQKPVLQGSAGMHLHSSLQKEAECRGISGAKWMTEAARKRLTARYAGEGKKVPHEGPAPDWDCSCGSYFFRTFADAWITDYNAYAHVTCLGRTMLHASGGRTTQYSVDYLLAPEKEGQVVYLPDANPPSSQILPPSVMGYYAPVLGKQRDQKEALEGIGLSLGVPILDRDDLRGCPVCLLINGWRDESEITEQMRKDWFGASYRSP